MAKTRKMAVVLIPVDRLYHTHNVEKPSRNPAEFNTKVDEYAVGLERSADFIAIQSADGGDWITTKSRNTATNQKRDYAEMFIDLCANLGIELADPQ